MDLRILSQSDLGAIMQIETALFGSEAWSEETMSSELITPHSYYIGVFDSALVGYAGLRLAPADFAADVLTIGVAASMQGKGIGRQLIAAGTDWAKGHGLTVVRVRSNITRSQTHQFYRHLGFADKKQQLVFEKTEES